ncbi:MAG TPA: hypothetical protein VGF84_04275 [Micromonosporaceae bacterium]|jgi:hypothetical protein
MPEITAAIIAALVAIVVAYLSARWAGRQQMEQLQARLREELRTEFMAESAIRTMLTEHKPLRSFARIKARVGGFDRDEDQLRRLLVRSGALRYWSTDGKHTEFWGLRERYQTRSRVDDPDEVDEVP